jgi:hypothetical protein
MSSRVLFCSCENVKNVAQNHIFPGKQKPFFNEKNFIGNYLTGKG